MITLRCKSCGHWNCLPIRSKYINETLCDDCLRMAQRFGLLKILAVKNDVLAEVVWI